VKPKVEILLLLWMLASPGYTQTQQAKQPAAKSSKPSAAKSAPANNIPGIPGTKAMVLDAGARAKGVLALTQAGEGEFAVKFAGQLQVIKDGPLTAENEFFLLAVPGVRYSISTTLQFPADLPGTRLSGKANRPQKLEFNSKTGQFSWVSDGPADIDVIVKGKGGDPSHFELTPAGAAPLVFEITVSGWRYISGKGTVKTPNGKILSMPN